MAHELLTLLPPLLVFFFDFVLLLVEGSDFGVDGSELADEFVVGFFLCALQLFIELFEFGSDLFEHGLFLPRELLHNSHLKLPPLQPQVHLFLQEGDLIDRIYFFLQLFVELLDGLELVLSMTTKNSAMTAEKFLVLHANKLNIFVMVRALLNLLANICVGH